MKNSLLKNSLMAGVVTLMLLLPLPAAAEQSVCLQCHAGQPERLSAPIAAWQQSVHKENSITCHDCHGGDPTDFAMAMSPERGFLGVPEYEAVPAFCGRCHVGIREDYEASAHGQALGNGGPNCVVCHGNHAVVKASLALINEESCSRCHEYGRAADIKGALAATDSRIAALEAQLQQLSDEGLSTDAIDGALFALRNDYHRLFHSVDVEQVVGKTAAFQARLDELSAKAAAGQDNLGQRKLVGGVVVALLVLAGILLLMLRKTFEGGD